MSNYTLRQLIEQLEALDAQLAPLREEARAAALEELKAKIAEFDFTAYELGLVKTQQIKRGRDGRTFRVKAKPQARPPLYRDPETGATWSGRGRPPAWLDGQPDEYLIKEEA
jgi:DNA-binding protein H-NS